jgi:ATP-dependent RNA helicase DeaD
VINYDMPPKVEPYVHRIGRTGRAGRTGEAILFVNRNERWMLRHIEKATRQKIREIQLPSNKTVNQKRVADFKHSITRALASEDLDFFQDMIQGYALEQEIPVAQVAAALAKLAHGDTPFLLSVNTDEKKGEENPEFKAAKTTHAVRKNPGERNRRSAKGTPKMAQCPTEPQASNPMEKTSALPGAGILPIEKGMERYRIEVGRRHGVQAGNIVGAIANEAGLDRKHIGKININQEFSFVDLPFGMPAEIFSVLKKTWVKSQQMAISRCA